MEGGEIWYENLIFDPLTKENNLDETTTKSKNTLLFDDIMEDDNNFYLENDSSVVFNIFEIIKIKIFLD